MLALQPDRAFGSRSVIRPGEHVQMDTTRMDVMVRIDEKTVARPELTILLVEDLPEDWTADTITIYRFWSADWDAKYWPTQGSRPRFRRGQTCRSDCCRV